MNPGSELEQVLAIALEAALKADVLLREALRDKEPLQIDEKGRHDFVTQVDRRSETLIRHILQAGTPQMGILGEEGTGVNIDADYLWVVDPLDGTSNFIHGYPAFAVSIGLLERTGIVSERDMASCRYPQVANCRPVLGVIVDVCQRRVFHAVRGGGAWCSTITDKSDRLLGQPEALRIGTATCLENAFIATGFPIRHKDIARLYLNLFAAIMPCSAGVRRGGSAALDLAYTAAGIFDAFLELQLAPWDMAAGLCLVAEAGGVYRGLGGDPLADGHLVAGNPFLVEDLLARLVGRL